MSCNSYTPLFIALIAGSITVSSALGMENCVAKSAATLTPVIELYTSEGCSSCPTADVWLSTFKAAQKEGKVVAQAFHVNYWDYIGWTDRFAAPAYTQRQRELSARTRLNSIYTPQIAKNGLTIRDYGSPAALISANEPAKASIELSQLEANRFEAKIAPLDAAANWSAYFTVTEHEHISRVTAGENKGESLKHDFVVRQYVPLGQFSGPQTLKFSSLAPTPSTPLSAGKAHARQINLIVTDNKSGKTLQALSLGC